MQILFSSLKLKTLELEQMGVQEMNAVESKKTDGGFWILSAIALGIYLYDHKEQFAEGFNAGLNCHITKIQLL